MRPKLCSLAVAVSLAAGGLFAQIGPPPEPKPSPKPAVVRVRMGSYAGMCVGWCDTVTSIGISLRIARGTAYRCQINSNEQKTRTRITRKEWREVQSSIDATVLAAMDQRTGCPGCADEMVQWVEVQFSDGTKKGIAYNAGTGPRAIGDLLKKLGTIESSTPRRLN